MHAGDGIMAARRVQASIQVYPNQYLVQVQNKLQSCSILRAASKALGAKRSSAASSTMSPAQ